MTLAVITPAAAQEMLVAGARLIDVRSADEFAQKRIPNAENLPLDRIGTLRTGPQDRIIFQCLSGQRTRMNADRLAAAAGGSAHVLEGGLMAWQAAGLPVQASGRQTLPLQRQVQLTIGGIIVAASLLSLLVPLAAIVPALMGCGLILAGTTGWCGMARLMARAPWNRAAGRHMA